MKSNFFLFLIGSIFYFTTSAQEIVKDSTKNLKLNLFPVAFFSPETDFGFGVIGVASFWLKGEERTTRASTFQFGASYTTRNQILVFAPFEFYSDNEKWRMVGELGFYKYVYNYFGQGINSRKEDLETYTVTFPRVRWSLLREIYPKISVGAGYEYDGYSDLIFKEGGLLAASNVLGNTAGTISNIGLLAFYDTRDDIFYPSKGFFIQGSYFTSSSVLGADFKYSKLQLDSRYYKQIGKRQILAANLFLGSATGDVPFLDQFVLGARRTRGMNSRRFQDNSEATFVLEYRFNIYGRFDGAAFGSSGTVMPSLSDIFSAPYKNAAGLGLRYKIAKRDNLRLRADYGVSKDGGFFSFTVREAF